MNNEYNIMKQKIRFKLTDRYLVLLICFLGYISTVSAQSHKISGVVVDEGKSPIIGATIQVKGANNGTITDIDGNFSLEVKSQGPVTDIVYRIYYYNCSGTVKREDDDYNAGSITQFGRGGGHRLWNCS